MLNTLAAAWRKNAPELKGLVDGALPEFVWARRPRDALAGVPVFCFHLVDGDELEADLEFLARNGYQTLRGRDFVDYLEGRRSVPERSILLTFDDGPRSFFEVAHPVLTRHRAHATAFIAPGLHAPASVDGSRDARPMTWEEIRSVHDAGFIEFQSHTLESRFVPRWPAPVPLAGCPESLESERRGTPMCFARDLALSKSLIEAQLAGVTVDQLAFPMYVGTGTACDEARALGFKACYWGLLPGRSLNRVGDSPFHISRMSDEYLRRLPGSGRISLSQLLRNRLRRITAAKKLRRELSR